MSVQCGNPFGNVPVVSQYPCSSLFSVQCENCILNKLKLQPEGLLRTLVKIILCVYKTGEHFLTFVCAS